MVQSLRGIYLSENIKTIYTVQMLQIHNPTVHVFTQI